ncbi:N-acetylmuramoyl-L-alanine amidase [Pontibacillus litoralis]|uniref:MurNAc-LAA domain-containing protein n=1 Tax=Pontibacillus litoralis JSM 072002 TaxID=1385512 RepID=A0A0A5FZT8_9BACI|nr:N-acetylmuramoyl-L-alanine amidase [Pontibacillus litoralis]KGX86346.1 hypothetical protein N784_05190 [Pontibacillus litoralis JSM 072002]
MVKRVACDHGHGLYTKGKRTPDGKQEWLFNQEVGKACMNRLKQYDAVEVIRLDDPTGKEDVSLNRRTDKANRFGADILVSIHHNAYMGKWGNHTGTETYTYIGNWPYAERLAEELHQRVLNVYGLRDRGLKKANFHMLRESTMPAVLLEMGFMDSTVDIEILSDKRKLAKAGVAIADGIADYLGLTLKQADQARIQITDLNPGKIEMLSRYFMERHWWADVDFVQGVPKVITGTLSKGMQKDFEKWLNARGWNYQLIH